MQSVNILGGTVPVEFKVGDNPLHPLDPALLMAGLEEVAALIEAKRALLSSEEQDAFRGMRKIVFFEGAVEVNTWTLTRPGCDEDDAIFYWEANEFLENPRPPVRANTFFHDCWHVVQFKRAGDFARTPEERVQREIDAINHQIVVAQKLGCTTDEVRYLQNFESDQGLILARLKEGVDRMHHADPAAGAPATVRQA